MPGLGLILCFLSSAATIALAERISLEDRADPPPVAAVAATGGTGAHGARLPSPSPSPSPSESRLVGGYSTISISSTSKVSAAPGGIRPLARLSP